MKLVLSLLVVANVLLFGWLRGWMAPFGGDGREPGRVERQVAPDALRVLPAARSGSAGTAGTGGAAAGPTAAAGRATPAAPGGPTPSADAPPGAALAAALRAANCAEIGPMAEAEAVRVQVALDAVAADLAVATQRAEDTTSWWVYLAPGPTDVSKRLAELRERGVTDTYVMPDGPWKGAISLGLFRQEDLAAALQKTIAAKGVRGARVAPRGPSPGRITLQVRPVGEAVAAELARLRAAIPDAVARPCAARG
ncbi:MAG: hypothetical protein ACK5XG_11485 [Burkholderiales bacterium]|jgi:hypothetical protein|nr:hypothetical protein [Burkholderiales bacterium]